MLAQEHDQGLLHQRLGHRLRAEARLAHLGQHDFESLAQGVARREILDHGLPQEVEEPERAGVGCGDVAADEEHVGAAVPAGEAHQALGQRAVILATRLSDRRFGLTERVREPRRHDDDALLAKRLPLATADPDRARTGENIMDHNGVERREREPPAALNATYGEGVELDGEGG